MSDSALSALYSKMQNSTGPLWWFADEQVSDEMPSRREDCWVFSNRCDTAAGLTAAGFNVALGDFDIDAAGAAAPATICYRVSKEKPLVHFLINEAARRLPIGGVLLLSGFKNDGLKTYGDKAAKMLSTASNVRKMSGNAYVAELVKQAEPEHFLPDSDYRELRQIATEPLLFSKPGIYGWQKQDRGSALLIDSLGSFLDGFTQRPRSLADLGCGYGYLPVMASAQLPDSHWLLTDNNATALLACAKNVEAHGLSAELYLADCAEGVSGPVDAVLCNPPFHQGFAVEGSLTERFLAATHRLLRNDGQALFVVNQFIPLQRKAEGLFSHSEVIADRDGFRVIRLRK